MATENQKIPCGGFRIGDGLAMDGDTLKSLGGAFVKVNTNDGKTYEFMDDSPLKTYDEIVSKNDEAEIYLIQYHTHPLPPGEIGFETDFDNMLVLKGINEEGIYFHGYYVDTIANSLYVIVINIAENNQITRENFVYTLTPAT